MREAASKGNPMAAPAPAQEEDRWTADRCCTVAIVAYQSYPTSYGYYARDLRF